MSDDYLLLSEIMDKYGITVKQLALATGRAASSTYRYLSGEATIPSIVWRVLFERTRDDRIIKLLTGEVPCAVVPMLEQPLRLDKATIKQLLKVRQKQINCESHVLTILADGAVDAADRRAIEKYRIDFPDLINSLYQVYHAIEAEYRQNGGKL